jgi:hypothetical protein
VSICDGGKSTRCTSGTAPGESFEVLICDETRLSAQ